jgi:2,5-furandicarboxylate decarboxylase 1
MALGIDERDLIEEYLRRRDSLLPFRVTDDGPVKEVVIKEGIDIRKILPVPVHHEKDVNPYITSGVLFLKDPESDKQSIGIHRIQLLGADRLGVSINFPPSLLYLAKAKETGKPLEAAVVVGMEPFTWFSSVIWAPGGHNKLEIAGGLREKPVELLRCATVNLKIPSTAEVVIEGRIQPNVRVVDGPFGEVVGYYRTFADEPVMDISAVTHSKNFIYQDLMPWSKESDTLLEYSYGLELYKDLKKLFPSIAGFHFLEGTCMLNAAISISKKSEGDVKRALYLALNLNPNMKNVIVVDDDVDIYSITELSWALATRFQPNKDIIIVSDVSGSFIDPSVKENQVTAKIGIDATKPIGAEREKFVKVRVSPDVEERTSRLLKKYGG